MNYKEFFDEGSGKMYYVTWTQEYDNWVQNEQLTPEEEMVEIGLLLSDYHEAQAVLARIMAL
jgi:hypothetical protein